MIINENINIGHFYKLIEINVNAVRQIYVFQKALFPLNNTNCDIINKIDNTNWIEKTKENAFETLVETENLLAQFISNFTILFNTEYPKIAKERNWNIDEIKELVKLSKE